MQKKQPIKPHPRPFQDRIEARRNDRAFQARIEQMIDEERSVLEQLAK